MSCLYLAFIQEDMNLSESILLHEGLVFHLSDCVFLAKQCQ